MIKTSKVEHTVVNRRAPAISTLKINNALRLGALGVLLMTGYFQYVDSYQFPKWKVFVSGMIMGAPFSLGIVLATLHLGKRHKFMTSMLILFSALLRSLLLIPPQVSTFLLIIDFYAVWNVFADRGMSDEKSIRSKGRGKR